MITREFLDLTVMVLKENYDLWIGNDRVIADLEAYMGQTYDRQKVIEAIDYIIMEQYGQTLHIPDDYEC